MLTHQYSPIHKPNQLICGHGHTAIVTGWTVKETVAKKLEKTEYAVIGQLYSPTRGIDFLIRNLLFNPHVRFLIIINATKEDRNAKSCQCLLDFFHHGFELGTSDTDRPCWVIKSDITGYIDVEVESNALKDLRRLTTVVMVNSVTEAVAKAKSYSKFRCNPRRSPQQFPKLEITANNVLCGARYGHRIEGSTIAETWVKLLHRIRTTGTVRPTGYDGKWQELINLMAIVTDEPKDFYFPEPNYLPCDREFIASYLPQMVDDAPYREGVKYTYGQRLRSWFGVDQIEQVITKLIKEVDAASAVLNLWDSGTGNQDSFPAWSFDEQKVISGDPNNKDHAWCDWIRRSDLNHDRNVAENFPLESNQVARYGRSPLSSDHAYGGSPCLNHIWIRVVNGQLSLTATFRSNDMFGAWVSNAMGLRALQWHILDQINSRSDLNLAIAPLITISQSAHIYDDTWGNVDSLISKEYSAICNQRNYSDPCGNFVIEVVGSDITVIQSNPSGEAVKEYRGNNPLKLIRSICDNSPSIQPDHIGYLGMELQKAAQCIKSGDLYNQDR